MTVYLYTGTPGSGKSLHLAKLLYWDLKLDRPVIANFDVNTKHNKSFYKVENEKLTPDYLVAFANEYFRTQEFKEGSIQLYIDESQVIFGNRDWRNADRAGWIRFFTQHRKFGYNVFLVAQHHEMIDKQIRALVEYEVMHRKLNNVGLLGNVVNLVTFGHPVVCAVTRWYGMRMKLSSEWLVGTKNTYSLYDTRKIFNAS